MIEQLRKHLDCRIHQHVIARRAGRMAATIGRPITDNPYKPEMGFSEFSTWNIGHEDGCRVYALAHWLNPAYSA